MSTGIRQEARINSLNHDLRAKLQAAEQRVAELDCISSGYYDQAVKGWTKANALEQRCAALEGALSMTLDEIEAGPLKDSNFGDFFRSDIGYADVKRRRALLAAPASASGEE